MTKEQARAFVSATRWRPGFAHFSLRPRGGWRAGRRKILLARVFGKTRRRLSARHMRIRKLAERACYLRRFDNAGPRFRRSSDGLVSDASSCPKSLQLFGMMLRSSACSRQGLCSGPGRSPDAARVLGLRSRTRRRRTPSRFTNASRNAPQWDEVRG